MVIKNIVIPLDTEYLNGVAKKRGVSRTMLARLVMERIIEKQMINDIIGTDAIIVSKPVKYRRFAPKAE